MKKTKLIVGAFVATLATSALSFSAHAQSEIFTRQDTLRGSITPDRSWWDLTYYHLSVTPHAAQKSIEGVNQIHYKVLQSGKRLQIDLQQPLKIKSVSQEGKRMSVMQEGNAWFVTLEKPQVVGEVNSIEVTYEGQPRIAVNPPWDGGVQWEKDSQGNDFIATSCQELGASAWWPCKDHMYDEPDSMQISITVPQHLKAVSNGQLQSVERKGDLHTFHWKVTNPINNYGVNMNIGKYEEWHETYTGEKGQLPVSYYVLPEDLEKAKVQFKQAPEMLTAFEHWFGPYPFYSDGFKIVHVPYLGMEHQSSVTYGNKFANGYLGRDLSGTGWGMKFDFIIVHESGHEWFANNITYKDIADMWIHEAFTAYSESLFVEYYHGKKAGAEYVVGTRKNIQNQAQIMGVFGVNKKGSGDMYYKGANMLHTIRQVVNNDKLWRELLRGLNQQYYHKTVEGSEIIAYVNNVTGLNLTPIFNQYLKDIRIPVLEYQFVKGELKYRWGNTNKAFAMPVKVVIDGKESWLHPTTEWKSQKVQGERLTVDSNFYVKQSLIKG